MEYDYKWKFKRKRFYLRLKDKEKILKTEYYKGRDISNVEFIIQNYLNNKELLPFNVSYEFEFRMYDWKVDIYTYNVDEYGKFWNCGGDWYIGGSVDDYRLYLDTIECEHKIPNDKIKCDKQFFNVDFKKGNDKVDNKVLLKIKYNW